MSLDRYERRNERTEKKIGSASAIFPRIFGARRRVSCLLTVARCMHPRLIKYNSAPDECVDRLPLVIFLPFTVAQLALFLQLLHLDLSLSFSTLPCCRWRQPFRYAMPFRALCLSSFPYIYIILSFGSSRIFHAVAINVRCACFCSSYVN